MMLKRLFFSSLLFLFAAVALNAQTPTTQGKEFWVSFMRNGYRNSTYNPTYEKLVLIASAKHACTVTVSNPNLNWQQQFNILDNNVSTIVVPDSYGYNDQKGGIANKGLYVTATDTISLYIANEAQNSYDAANVLPLEALGTHYMIQSNKSIGEQGGTGSSHYGESRAAFLVVATEDDTHVQITPSCLTFDDHTVGRPYSVTLNRGECYHVINKNAGSEFNRDGDFSGTLVTSEEGKKIAVFNGNCITSVPGGLATGYDHIFEQAMPTGHWGKRFVVTGTKAPGFYNLQDDLVKITALHDNTTVYREGEELCQLNAGASATFEMHLASEECAYLESDGPIAVYLYNHSHQSGGGNNYGDPSMVWIAPVEQTVFEVNFSTFSGAQIQVHYVNIVCFTEHVSELTLDGNSIAGDFSEVPSAPQLSFARVGINAGAHLLHCPGGLVAHVYGLGVQEGYAYTVGSSAKTLTNQLYVDEILSTDLPNGYDICQNETVHFRVETNYEIHHVEWDFGDNTQGDGVEVSHPYTSAGDFDVQSVVFRSIEGVVEPFETMTVTIHANPINTFDKFETSCADTYTFRGVDYPVPCDTYLTFPSDEGCDTICHLKVDAGNLVTYSFLPQKACESFVWFGDTIVTEGQNHLEHAVPNATPEGCDSLYLVDVTIYYPPQEPERTMRSCDEFVWWGQHCTETGTYTQTFNTDPDGEGCEYDSILHFIYTPPGMYEESKDTCDYFDWQGRRLVESGVYHDTIVGNNGCETYLTLNLTLHYSPAYKEIRGLEHISVSNSFWPGEYHYHLDDSTGFDPARIHWSLEAPSDWKFTPHGASCTLVATSMGTAELKVASSFGNCDKEVSMTIHAGGFNVEELQEVSAKVYPNPAKDELVVECEEMESVIVYDVRGQKVKETLTQGASHVTLGVGSLTQGLYLVEIHTKKGNKTQLFSVIR